MYICMLYKEGTAKNMFAVDDESGRLVGWLVGWLVGLFIRRLERSKRYVSAVLAPV